MLSRSFNGEPTQILVVDDNRADIKFLQRAFAKTLQWTVRVSAVDDGEKAIAYLEGSGAYRNKPRPDLIILDLDLPRRTGPEVLRWIRTHKKLSRLPAVLLSSNPKEMIREQVTDEGVEADGYFTKPGDFHQLLGIVAAIRRCYEDASRRALKMPPKSARLTDPKVRMAGATLVKRVGSGDC